MERQALFEKVKTVLVDALVCDEEEVTPEASLVNDLGAESIDFLDIVFKLEQEFGVKIPQGELFPEGVTQNPRYVQDGRVTGEGLAELKAKLPHVDFSEFEKDPQISKVAGLFTVDTVCNFMERKLEGASA